MSHYSVAVFTDGTADVETLLEPYSEERSVEPYLEFTKQGAIEYGREHYQSCRKMTDEEVYDFMSDGYEIQPNGDLYSTYNPDSKWDWWTVGGRFSGQLKDKRTGEEVSEGYMRDLEFAMDKEEYKRSLEWWKTHIDNGNTEDMIVKPEYYQRLYRDAETYARFSSTFNTYAVVTPDGEWHAPGEVGYFGVSSESEDEAREWYEKYEERFIKGADPDWYLTIVDCHI